MAIILEDDLILNENFLDYMNNSLKKYKHSKKFGMYLVGTIILILK